MKSKFSDRVGITEVNKIIQTDSMTPQLRNQLWNIFNAFYLAESRKHSDHYLLSNSYLSSMAINIWMYYLKKPIDTIYYEENHFIQGMRKYFFSTEWFNVYNFLEFSLNFADKICDKEKYLKALNLILEMELSGYRIVNDQFVPITSEVEINSLNESLNSVKSKSFAGVYSHLSTSINLLANKGMNDANVFRNSIKESISAVESLCNILNKEKSKGLKDTLKLLKSKIKIHTALEEGFIKLYGYTSDSDGIRHSLMDEPNLNLEDAIYMLVTCSSFINYIIQKAQKAKLF